MSPEKLNAICDAVDAVMEFSEPKRKAVVQKSKYLQSQVVARYEQAADGKQLNHSDVIRIHELETEADQWHDILLNWPNRKAAAVAALEACVGINLQRVVSPELQALVQALAKVKRRQADGTFINFSLKYIALATGLSEGTVSKLRSGGYPLSSFPVTVKVGRRGARR